MDILRSYSFNRYHQFTKIGNIISTKRKISCGVPQGSSLGPLLFILYVNDLPLASQFLTALSADDTYLALFDINLSNLEQKVNYQLQLIYQWLKRNKLTLNYSKTTYLVFSKQPHMQVCFKFRLHINKSLLERENAVKYLGVWIDDKLNWSAHIKNLSLQLAKSCTMFFHLRDFVTDDTLGMLYYSLVYSHLIYGITAQGTAHQHKLHEIEVKLNNIVRTITKTKSFLCYVSLQKAKFFKFEGCIQIRTS